MKSVYKSNISWFIFFYLFGILLPYAMEENKTKTKTFSVKQLQNDFIGLWKNPQKYVEFQLNADKTSQPDAGGLYELLPYYQKINPLGEKTNYAIQWCAFENKWQLVEVNPLPSLNNEVSTIATLLEGDHSSKPKKADVKAYTTYEQMKSVVKTVGEQNKELKIKMIEMENEIALVQTKNENFKALAKHKIKSVQDKNEQLTEKLKKSIEQNEKWKAYALEQKSIVEKTNEVNKIKNEEHENTLEEIELLKTKLKEKEAQINKKNESMDALEKRIGGLSFELDLAKEFEKKFKSVEKDAERQKNKIKEQAVDLKMYEESFYTLASSVNKKNEDLKILQEHLLLKDQQIFYMKKKLKFDDQKNENLTEKNKFSTNEKGILHNIKNREEKTKMLSQITDNVDLLENRNVQKHGNSITRPAILTLNDKIDESQMKIDFSREQINMLQKGMIVSDEEVNDSINRISVLTEKDKDFAHIIKFWGEKIDFLQDKVDVSEKELDDVLRLETKINDTKNKLKEFEELTETKDVKIEGELFTPNIIVNAQKANELQEKTIDISEDELIHTHLSKENDEQVRDLEQIMNNYFQKNNLTECDETKRKEKFKTDEPIEIENMDQYHFIQSKENKKNKIVNEIEEILLKSMPASPNEENSLDLNELLTVRQSEYKTCVSLLLNKLRDQEDENLLLSIKSCVESNNTSLMNSNPNYQYEYMLMQIGVIDYARDAEFMINNAKSFDMKKFMDVFKTCHTDFLADQQKLYVKHEKILDDMLKSVKDEKLKTKIRCFKESKCLFEAHKYKYENYIRTIGIILYGFGYTSEEESIQSETQILKNDNILTKSAKSKKRRKKHKLNNETNIETKMLETPPKTLCEGLAKFEHLQQKTITKLHETKTQLQIEIQKEADQSEDNHTEKVVINDAENDKITNEQFQEDIAQEISVTQALQIFMRELYFKEANDDID